MNRLGDFRSQLRSAYARNELQSIRKPCKNKAKMSRVEVRNPAYI